MEEIKFKSYCFSIGTTSYRTSQMNVSIERQLNLMNNFRNLPENANKSWRELQSEYYLYLHDNNFLDGNASRPDKDAREKTSGLYDIGLLNKERLLTEAGQALLELSINNDFRSDNILEISKDSYLYLKQLLKTSIEVDGETVRPFIVLTYLLSIFGYLSKEEFTYFLPMCINAESTNNVIKSIKLYRKGELDITTALYNLISSKDNYKKALQLFLNSENVTPELICTIGFNRKSKGEGKAYDTVFYKIYKILIDIYLNKKNKAEELFEAVNYVKGNTKILWKKFFFGKNQLSNIKKLGLESILANVFDHCFNIDSLKNCFFMVMHSFKVQANLCDYADLNKRYFKLSDCVLFRDNKVEFDVLPKAYFNVIANDLYVIAFEKTNDLPNDVEIEKISPLFIKAKEMLYLELSNKLGVAIENGETAKQLVYNERYARFNSLVNSKFDKKSLLTLIEQFEKRDDKKITSYLTDNADIPTLFEYVLGIAWYRISEYKGDILNYLNLSLDADLLPKTHAGGGMADIVYKYNGNEIYPTHTVLIEATLSEKAGQRSMEIEPVTRHLGEYLANNEEETYSIFIPTYLNPNVVTDFRMRKDYPYLANNGKYVDGMKIIPLQSSELKTILQKNITYSNLYKLFEVAYNSQANIKEWYNKTIVDVVKI